MDQQQENPSNAKQRKADQDTSIICNAHLLKTALLLAINMCEEGAKGQESSLRSNHQETASHATRYMTPF